MIVHVTDIELARKMWPTVGPLLDKAVRHTNGCFELEDVWADIERGKQQLWLACSDDGTRIDAAMTTMFDQYPRKKTLKVVFVGGARMRTWLAEFRTLVEAFARKHGAAMLEGYFREGWVRVWPGARVTGVGIIKEL